MRNHSAAPRCDYKCSALSTLKIHERVHTGDKPFSCSQCSYKCTQKAHLISHERIHTNEKPFSCLVCSKKFSLLHSLKIHERIHTNEKPFSFSKCDKQLHRQVICRPTKESTPMRNHSAAQSVKRSSATQVI